MQSIEKVKGSDGSGNANVATVQNSRSPGASTIIVDTVLGINPSGFAGSMGTPHTFTDPITSETITVISEATAVDFTGHVDGSNLEIDDVAPGYVDAGSEVGDIVIIKPTTQYADNLADVLAESHEDDGLLKSNIVATANLLANSIHAILLAVSESTDFQNGTALAANAWTDFKGNQNFTTTTANSIVVVLINASTVCGGTNTSTMATRVVIDSAGTPVNKVLGGFPSTGTEFINPFANAAVAIITGLSIGTHTIKSQIRSTSINSIYCRASSLSDTEFYTTTVIELKK